MVKYFWVAVGGWVSALEIDGQNGEEARKFTRMNRRASDLLDWLEIL